MPIHLPRIAGMPRPLTTSPLLGNHPDWTSASIFFFCSKGGDRNGTSRCAARTDAQKNNKKTNWTVMYGASSKESEGIEFERRRIRGGRWDGESPRFFCSKGGRPQRYHSMRSDGGRNRGKGKGWRSEAWTGMRSKTKGSLARAKCSRIGWHRQHSGKPSTSGAPRRRQKEYGRRRLGPGAWGSVMGDPACAIGRYRWRHHDAEHKREWAP